MNKILLLLCVIFLPGTLPAENVIAARRNFRQEAAEKSYDYQFLVRKTADPDKEIARYAIVLLAQHHPDKTLPVLRKLAASAADPLIAEAILTVLADYPESEAADIRRRTLAQCPDPRFQIFNKVRLPHRMNLSLRNDPAYDHAVTVIKKIKLPENNWRFTTDPDDTGFLKNYFAVNFNDTAWRKLSVTKTWEEQGVTNYDGIAWYRVKFNMPGKMDCAGVDIAFGAVDESAWVWLNGKYVGQHDIGPAGWDSSFYLNIASELKWGKENILTVRVKDTAAAGGIWKPVTIEVLQ